MIGHRRRASVCSSVSSANWSAIGLRGVEANLFVCAFVSLPLLSVVVMVVVVVVLLCVCGERAAGLAGGSLSLGDRKTAAPATLNILCECQESAQHKNAQTQEITHKAGEQSYLVAECAHGAQGARDRQSERMRINSN